MIKSIRIKNFKKFQDIKIPLNSLTLFIGQNSAGKSTALQSILMLMQSNINFDANDKINISGNYCNLGTNLDIFNDQSGHGDCLEIELEHIHNKTDHTFNILSTFNNQIVDSIGASCASTPNLVHPLKEKSFIYIPAERPGPRLFQTLNRSAASLGQIGNLADGALGVLALHRDYKIDQNDPRYHDEASSVSLLNQTKRYMEDISPNVDIEVELSEHTDSVSAKFQNADRSRSFRSTNIGFGISYTLPIVVACLMAQKDSLIIIENPEAHLHPEGQKVIADLLKKTAKSGCQILVETHSREILYRLKHHSSEDECALITCNYFDSDGVSSLSPINSNVRILPESFYETMGSPMDFMRTDV